MSGAPPPLAKEKRPTESGGTEDSVVAALARRFRVCWEVWPEYAVVGGERRQIGFALDLNGTHEAGIQRPDPGCTSCRRVYTALHRLARHILPHEHRPSIYDLDPFDNAIHYAESRGGRPEICLSIRLLHREHMADPVDECERRCLAEMKQRLKELGVPEGRPAPAETRRG